MKKEFTNQDELVEELLKNLPPEEEVEVPLPSEGRFYTKSNGMVTIRPMTFEDEKFLLSNQNKGEDDVINMLLKRCTKGVTVGELIFPDKKFLLLKLRAISLGKEYPVAITCPKCKFETKTEIDLTKLVVKPLPPDLKDPREIELPLLKRKITVRFPRVKDEKYLKNIELTQSQLWRFVEAIEDYKDPAIISKVINKLPLKDMIVLTNELMREDVGIDPRFLYHCGNCDKESEMAVPISDSFFTVI